MKKLNKIVKQIQTLIIAAIIAITSIVRVSAAQDTIQLAPATKVGAYIAGVSFSYKTTTDGKYLYCLDMHRSTAQNVQATLVKNSKYVDGGITYILKNGYPVKSITGDKDKDYYITQTAVWWYLDNVVGTSNLGNGFKSTGSDSYGLRQYVKKLVDEGYAHRNDSNSYSTTALVISGDSTMTLDGDYYVSKSIKATTATNISSYTVSLENAKESTKIVKSDGTEVPYKGEFSVGANESFKIKVLAKDITDSTTIKVNAKAAGVTQYAAYEYQPKNSNMQNVALLESKQDTANSSLNLEISTSKVVITKIDSVTKKAISGATLVLKDSEGKKITSWESTVNSHIIRNLTNGTYTIEEVKPPKGYILNTNVTKFTITDTNRVIEINIENAPKKVVVNIVKVDQDTNAPLADAEMVVKDAAGNVIARFTTTTEPYVLTDLENGTYTVEELRAPAGYIKSDEIVKFTVDDEHLSHQVTFVNAKEVYVPDTASISSIIMIIIGIVITGLGLRFIYKNRKYA